MGLDREMKFTCDRCAATERKLEHAIDLGDENRKTFTGSPHSGLWLLPKDWHFVRLATGEREQIAVLCGGCAGVVKDALLPRGGK